VRSRIVIESDGVEFHFFYSKGSETVLHITDRHGTSPEQAITTYFEGLTQFDQEHDRFETVGGECALLWNWIERGKSLFVITCVRIKA